MQLALRNTIAALIVDAFAERERVADLRALARALAPHGAAVGGTLAARLMAAEVFTAGAPASTPPTEIPCGQTRVALRPALVCERAAAVERVTRALAVVERYWRECVPAPAAAGAEDRAPAPAIVGAEDNPRAGGDAVHSTGRLERALVQGAMLFNAGLFFEMHEILEAAWNRLSGDPRTFVQGLIQLGVALHHLESGNASGARTLFAAGRAKLAPYAPEYHGVAVGELLAGLVPWERAAGEGGAWPAGLALPALRVSCR